MNHYGVIDITTQNSCRPDVFAQAQTILLSYEGCDLLSTSLINLETMGLGRSERIREHKRKNTSNDHKKSGLSIIT